MAERPKGTYISNVFNPGFDKNLPFGFVDVVYSNDGSALGFMRDGNFYKLGEKADDASPKRQRAGTEGVPGLNDQRAAQAERDSLSTKLKDLDNKGVSKNDANYIDTYNKYNAAQKRLDDVNAKIEAYVEKNQQYKEEWKAAKEKQQEGAYEEIQQIVTQKEEVQAAKQSANNEKKRRQLEADKADAERRGDTEAARKAQQDINNIPQTPIKPKATTPTEKPRVSARAQEAGVNKPTASATATSTTTGTTTGGTTGGTTTGGTSGGTSSGTTKKKKSASQVKEDRKLTAENILFEYGVIDAVVQQDPQLKQAFLDFVSGKITEARFKNLINTSNFKAKYGKTIRDRVTYKAIHDSLSPEEQAAGGSQYSQELFDVVSQLKSDAQSMGATISDDDIKIAAENLYMKGQNDNTTVRQAALRPYIKLGVSPITGGATVGGKAGVNYQELLQTAYQNGVSVSELPKVLGYQGMDQVLQAISSGEPVTTFQQGIRSYASTGQSDFVKNQLAQGVDLRTVAQPYITAMAEVLELQPDSIQLNDSVLQSGLQNNGMNIFDYKKLLKKDNRWQYTKGAEQDVSNATMRILREFGFEG